MSRRLADAICDLLHTLEQERDQLDRWEENLARAAEMRLEDSAIALRIAEAVSRERTRVLLLIEEQQQCLLPGAGRTILDTLKKRVKDAADCTPDRYHQDS